MDNFIFRMYYKNAYANMNRLIIIIIIIVVVVIVMNEIFHYIS